MSLLLTTCGTIICVKEFILEINILTCTFFLFFFRSQPFVNSDEVRISKDGRPPVSEQKLLGEVFSTLTHYFKCRLG